MAQLDLARVRRVIASAVAEQGPAAREQYAAAADVMRALHRAGYDVVRRRPIYQPTGICLGCPFKPMCNAPRIYVIDQALEKREECPFYLAGTLRGERDA